MSDYVDGARKRGQNLLIVEGNHEKNKLFGLIFRCFPEINIAVEDVWIYGTNIYMLYQDIVNEYGGGWTADDVDLPFVVSKKQTPHAVRRKEDFVNIILVFDYERHDPNFSETKIQEMQDYFTDAADTGRLYINYPMIESYQHLSSLADDNYMERKVPVSLQPGKKYKELVRNETGIAGLIGFPQKIEELLNKHYGITDEQIRRRCYEFILNLSDEDDMEERIWHELQNVTEDTYAQKAAHHFAALVTDLQYAHDGETYWEYMRKAFCRIIFHNVCKANRIHKGQCQVGNGEYRKCFEDVNMSGILQVQNASSRDGQTGFIWVLNTSVFFVAEYNFSLVNE